MKLGIDSFTGLLCNIWDKLIISKPLLWKGTFKKVLAVLSVIFGALYKPNLKLARSFIISGMYFGIYCSKSRMFAKSIRMPSFLRNRPKTSVLISCTNPGLLQLLIKFLSLCSRFVRVTPCFRFRFIERIVNFLGFLLKSSHTTIFSVPFFDTLPKFFMLSFSP